MDEYYGQEDPGPAPPPEWAEPVYGMPTQTGMQEIYKAWQRFLARQGYDLGHWCADGDWGKKTKAATRAFQKDQGLMISPEGYMLQGTEIRANDMGLGTTDMVAPLTTAEKRIACPEQRGWFTKQATEVATSYDAAGAPVTQGALGDIADSLFTPRGIVIGVSSVALLMGVVALLRQGRSPRMGMADYNPADWTW